MRIILEPVVDEIKLANIPMKYVAEFFERQAQQPASPPKEQPLSNTDNEYVALELGATTSEFFNSSDF